MPAGGAGNQGGDRAGQQDAEQQPAHHLADDFAAARLGGEMGSDQEDDLVTLVLKPRTSAAARKIQTDGAGIAAMRLAMTAHSATRMSFLFSTISPSGLQQQETRDIAGLDGGDDEAGTGNIDAERLANRSDQGLGVIEVGDRRAGPGSEAKISHAGRVPWRAERSCMSKSGAIVGAGPAVPAIPVK